MAANVDDSKRARLVSLLWSLKRAISDAPESAVEGIHYIHFNALLRDDTYRTDVLEKAARSENAEIRRLAEEIQAIHVPDSLVGQGVRYPSSEMPDSETTSGHAPYSQHAPQQPAAGPQRRGGGTRVALVVAAVGLFVAAAIGIGTGFINEVRDVDVSGSIVRDTLWSANRTYHLKGLVFVEGGATLTIEPGARILGHPGSALIVTRDARINARGAVDAPIVFTSAKPTGERKRGDWGGVVLLGNALVNTKVAHIEGVQREDPRGSFGGGAPEDSCGILQYVRIEFAGYEISTDNELNGLTLGGCGSGTVLRHIQVHMGLDDGIEFFGGSANLSHVVISRADDDGLDWDRGWRGFGQYIIIQQDGADGDNGIEADNYKKDNNASPRSAPTLSNVTIINSGNPGIAQRGMTLRRGTGGTLRNVLLGGFTSGAIDIRDAATVEQVKNGTLSFNGIVFTDAGGDWFENESAKDDDGGFDEEAFFRGSQDKIVFSDQRLLGPAARDVESPLFAPAYNNLLIRSSAPVPQGEFWDEAANYVGALRPGSRTTWVDGWTAFPAN